MSSTYNICDDNVCLAHVMNARSFVYNSLKSVNDTAPRAIKTSCTNVFIECSISILHGINVRSMLILNVDSKNRNRYSYFFTSCNVSRANENKPILSGR